MLGDSTFANPHGKVYEDGNGILFRMYTTVWNRV